MITFPQREWLGALIYSKAEKAKKAGVELDFENCWSSERTYLPYTDDVLDIFVLIAENV